MKKFESAIGQYKVGRKGSQFGFKKKKNADNSFSKEKESLC